jgi:hypothetical protein
VAKSENLEESIVEALQRKSRQSTQTTTKEVSAPLDSKHQRVPPKTAKSLAHVCDEVAAEIQETGQTVVNIANTIAAETEALAELLRKHGAAMSARVDQFITMSDRVKHRMRDAHNDIHRTLEVTPSLAPQAEHGDEDGQEPHV